MKSLLVVMLLGTGMAATAQEPLAGKKLPFLPRPGATITTDTTGYRFTDPDNSMLQRGLLPQAVFSHKTSKGSIYNLPVDNMPCLVPGMDKVSRMPGKYFILPESKMPNVMPKQRIIPERSKEEKH